MPQPLGRNARVAGTAFLFIPVLILGASVICSWAIAHGASPEWRIPFRVFCHGIPERCFLLWGVPMPICARCTAIYIGLFAGLMTFAVMPWLREEPLRAMMFASIIPLGIDGITQLIHLRTSNNTLRFGTGLVAGLAFGIWVLSAIEKPVRKGLGSP